MAQRGFSSYGILKSAGCHINGLSPLTCSTLWQRMSTPSMLYGAELWAGLTKTELDILERVQRKIGKSIQGLHRRTHNEIVRGLLGWLPIQAQIDLLKLNFVFKLMSLDPTSIIKHIFLSQILCVMYDNSSTELLHSKSVTLDLWCVIRRYNMQPHLIEYLTGKPLINKTLWKQISKSAIFSHEEKIYRDTLHHKSAHRFLRIHNKLSPHPIYSIIRNNMSQRKELMNTIKLLAYPEECDISICAVWEVEYKDTVKHYIWNCQGLVNVRCDVLDNILDRMQATTEAQLLSKDDNLILDTLLSKYWSLLREQNEYIEFTLNTSKELVKLMYVL